MDLKTLLAEDVSQVKVEYNGHVILATYDAAALTPDLEARLSSGGESGTTEVAEMVVALVHDWDLEESEGQPLAVTRDNVMKLPVKFLAGVVAAITKDLVADPLFSATSDAS